MESELSLSNEALAIPFPEDKPQLYPLQNIMEEPQASHSYEVQAPFSVRTDTSQSRLLQRASSNGGGIGRSLSSVSSAIGSLKDELDAGSPVQHWVRQHLQELERKLEVLLEHVTEDLATEVEREQQHLMLMQSQVDKQGQIITREVDLLHKKMEQEKTQRSFVQSAVRESKDLLAERLEQQGRELEALRRKLADLETPWIIRLANRVNELFWKGCSYSTASIAGTQPYKYGALVAPGGSPSRVVCPEVV